MEKVCELMDKTPLQEDVSDSLSKKMLVTHTCQKRSVNKRPIID